MKDEETTSYTMPTYRVTDAKYIHEELTRESHDYRNGWSPGTNAVYWMLWGGCVVLGIWFLVTGN